MGEVVKIKKAVEENEPFGSRNNQGQEIPEQDALALEWENRLKQSNKKKQERRETLYELLNCLLTPEMREDLSKTMCRADEAKERLENEIEGLTESLKDLKKELKDKDAQIRQARRDLQRGVVERSVLVEKVTDYDLGMVMYIRADTGEVYKQRQMDPDERQMVLV
ncbi:MAG: hypothetical protein AB1896_13650 [Thermodesulfobacteriota bacterium]